MQLWILADIGIIWDKIFKNEQSKVCGGWESSKNLKVHSKIWDNFW